MFCTHCGATLPEGSRFCTSCGQPVVAPVPRQEAGPSQTVVAPAGAQPTPMSAQPTTYLDQDLTTPVSPEPITEPLFPECGAEEPAQMASQPTVAYPHFNQGGTQHAYDTGVQQTYQAPAQQAYGAGAQQTYQALAQPVYQSVPQQPAYDYGQNSVGQTPQKGMSRGTLAAIIAAIVLVAAAAAVFIVLDPLGVIAPKHEAPATSVAAGSQPAETKPAETTPGNPASRHRRRDHAIRNARERRLYPPGRPDARLLDGRARAAQHGRALVCTQRNLRAPRPRFPQPGAPELLQQQALVHEKPH